MEGQPKQFTVAVQRVEQVHHALRRTERLGANGEVPWQVRWGEGSGLEIWVYELWQQLWQQLWSIYQWPCH